MNRPGKPIVRVNVYDLKTDQQIRQQEANLLKTDNREWLIKLLIWAISNGHSVEILHIEDDKRMNANEIA